MAKYEFTFLVGKEDEAKEMKELIVTAKGKVSKENNWGKKNLAYPIKKLSEAFFYNWTLDMTEEQTNEFKRKLNFNTKVLRYLMLKIE